MPTNRQPCGCCPNGLSRRDLLKVIGSALCVTAVEPAHAGIGGAERAAATDAAAISRPLLQAVPVRAVRLLAGSPFHHRQELHRREYLAAFEPDRLLFHYRAVAGVEQPAGIVKGYDGWDSEFLRGHMAGHFLSAASRMAVATGDAHLSERVTYLVRELALCQEALGRDGYLAAFPPSVFDWLEGAAAENGGVVVPYYIVHKLMAGLLDAHVMLSTPRALASVEKLADYFSRRCAALGDARLERIFRTDHSRNPQNEFGAMSDVLAQLFEVTGERRHLDLAQTFNRSWFIDPLSAGEDRLHGLHANTHIAQAIGIARCANLTGDPRLHAAVENFWRLVTRNHSFVNGGNSTNEWFDHPGVEAGPGIDGGKVLPATTAESCNTHNMLRLTAQLFAWRPDPGYADYHERALYNHLLATVAPDSGAVTYFMPMRGHFRTFLDGTFCCVGSGIENPPRYGEGICHRRDGDLWFNLYMPCELDWREAGWRLRMEGDVARGQPVRISVMKSARGKATLHFRVPAWVAGPFSIAVNGKQVSVGPPSSRFVAVRRRWRAGDEVRIVLPAALRLERAKDDPSMIAVFHGPQLLAGELGKEDMPDDFAGKDAYLKAPAVPVPDIVSASNDPADWLKEVPGSPLTFVANGAGPANGVVFRPLHDVGHQRYSVYWRLRHTAGGTG
jgi:DUF1680 family protein